MSKTHSSRTPAIGRRVARSQHGDVFDYAITGLLMVGAIALIYAEWSFLYKGRNNLEALILSNVIFLLAFLLPYLFYSIFPNLWKEKPEADFVKPSERVKKVWPKFRKSPIAVRGRRSKKVPAASSRTFEKRGVKGISERVKPITVTDESTATFSHEEQLRRNRELLEKLKKQSERGGV